MTDKICKLCNDTGYYGDNGPGQKGNNEWVHCECRSFPKPDTHTSTEQMIRYFRAQLDHTPTEFDWPDVADRLESQQKKIKKAIKILNRVEITDDWIKAWKAISESLKELEK